MWKRIHSNRNPQDTLYSELQKEFGSYFSAAGHRLRTIVSRKPKYAFSLMVILLTGSLVLSFTIFRQRDIRRLPPAVKASPVSEGFSELMNTTAKLRETIRLKAAIDRLSAKKQLTSADSARLSQTLDSLALVQQSLNRQRHEH